MSMDPPKVLLERTFLHAVADPEHPRHAQCLAAYLHLVDQYEHEQVLLVAVGDHLRAFDVADPPSTAHLVAWFLHRPRVGMFAPVDPLYVGFQHRRAADATDVDDPATALTLVMCERHKIRRIATLHAEFDQYDLEVEQLEVEQAG